MSGSLAANRLGKLSTIKVTWGTILNSINKRINRPKEGESGRQEQSRQQTKI